MNELDPMSITVFEPPRETGLPHTNLRPDLAFFKGCLGDRPLVQIFGDLGVKRILEIGVGSDFDAMANLAALRTEEGERYFRKSDLLATDMMKAPSLGYLLSESTYLPLSAQQLAVAVSKGDILPFDFVIGKGVVTFGGQANSEVREVKRDSLAIMKSVHDCLNPNNPNACALLSTRGFNGIIPFSPIEFLEAGLRVTHAERITDDMEVATMLFELLRDHHFYPGNYEFGFRKVVCKVV